MMMTFMLQVLTATTMNLRIGKFSGNFDKEIML